MSKNKVGDSVSTLDNKKLNRRNFIKRGAAIGVGTAAFGTASTGPTQAQGTQAQAITWDYEADVVVLGAGATGLPAAIRARDLGASVIVVEQNFDIGGTMIHSNGNVSLGGGDAIQLRDLAGKKDPEGLITIDPVEPPEAMRDDPDLLFRDQTDWTVVNTGARAAYRYNNREVLRAWADNVAPVRQFLLDNYVKFTRISWIPALCTTVFGGAKYPPAQRYRSHFPGHRSYRYGCTKAKYELNPLFLLQS